MSTMIAIILNATICSIIVLLFTISKRRITNKINNKKKHHERSNGNRSINRPGILSILLIIAGLGEAKKIDDNENQ